MGRSKIVAFTKPAICAGCAALCSGPTCGYREPLYLHYADQARTSAVLATDETNVMLLLPPEIPAPQEGDAKSQRIHEVLTS